MAGYAVLSLLSFLIWYAQRDGAPDGPWRLPALVVAAGVAVLHTVPFAIDDIGGESGWPGLAIVAALAIGTLISARRVAERVDRPRHAAAYAFLGGMLGLAMLGAALQPDTWPHAPRYFLWAGACAYVAAVSRSVWVAGGALAAAGLSWLAGTAGLWADLLTYSDTGQRQTAHALVWMSAMLSVGAALAVVLAARRDTLLSRAVGVVLLGAAGWLATQTLIQPSVHYATTPILNQLWLYFGLPGAVAAAGAVWLGRRRDDLGSQLLLAASLVFTLVMASLLIHHTMNAGDLSAEAGFEEFAVQLLVAFALLLGGSWVRGPLTTWPGREAGLGATILPGLAIGLSALSLVVFVVCQLFAFNPLVSAQTTIDGPPVFNALLLGYFAPAVLLGAAAIRYSGHRPVWFVRTLGGLAGISWLAWTTTQIRVFAQGEVIALDRVPWDNAELYAVSAAWLVTAIALLLAGLKTGRRDLRLGAVALLTVVTLKVFLLDMSELSGALRPLSFIGLGVVLLGIGRLYQTVLRKSEP